MNYTLLKFLKPFFPQELLNIIRKQRDKKQLKKWQKNSCPVPPPHIVKQLTIKEYQQKSGHSTLVETGTYLGEMVEAQKKRFKRIISIELGVDLFIKAQKRFQNDKNITIMQGDSGKVLPLIIKDLNEPSIFWLDGHYSGGSTAKGEKKCPIFEELNSILSDKKLNHILLIDDSRCFVGNEDYPTIEELTKYVKNKNEKYQVEIKNDIIRFEI